MALIHNCCRVFRSTITARRSTVSQPMRCRPARMPSAPAACNWDVVQPAEFVCAVSRARTDRARGPIVLVVRCRVSDPAVDRTIVLGPQASDLDTTTLGLDPDRAVDRQVGGARCGWCWTCRARRVISRAAANRLRICARGASGADCSGVKLGSDASGDLRLWEIDARSALSETLKRPRGLASTDRV